MARFHLTVGGKQCYRKIYGSFKETGMVVIQYFCGKNHVLFLDSCNRHFYIYVSVKFDPALYVRIGRKLLFYYCSASTIGANLVDWRSNFRTSESSYFPLIYHSSGKGINCEETKREDCQLSVQFDF